MLRYASCSAGFKAKTLLRIKTKTPAAKEPMGNDIFEDCGLALSLFVKFALLGRTKYFCLESGLY